MSKLLHSVPCNYCGLIKETTLWDGERICREDLQDLLDRMVEAAFQHDYSTSELTRGEVYNK